MLSSVSSSMFFTSRACSMTCWPSRTSMPSFCSLLEQREVRPRCAAHAEKAGAAVVGVQPRRVELVVPRGAAEVPDIRIAVAGEKRVARELVARPFADHRARGVADVVLVEREQAAEAGLPKRRAHARKPVVVQPPEVDALLEVHLRAPGCLQRAIPAMLRIDFVWLVGHPASSRGDSSP